MMLWVARLQLNVNSLLKNSDQELRSISRNLLSGGRENREFELECQNAPNTNLTVYKMSIVSKISMVCNFLRGYE